MDSRSRKRRREEHPDVSPDVDHKKKTKKKKPKSVLNQQEAQAQPSELSADNPQPLASKPEPTSPEDPEMKEKKEKKSMLDFEGAESNKPVAEDSQLCPKLDSAPPIDPYQRKKKEKKSVLKHEGAELNDLELCPILDPLAPKDSGPVLLPEPEPSHTKEPFQKKRKRRKRKKSMLKHEGAELNELELCPNLDLSPPKDSDPVLLPEPEPAHTKEPFEQKRKRRSKKMKSVINGEGTELNKPNAEPEKEDPLPPKDSDPAVLLEPDPAHLNEPDQQKNKKKKKNVLNFEGEESNGPIAVENPQLASECKPLSLKPEKKRLRKGSGLYKRCLKCGRLYTGDFCTKLQCVDENQEICFFCGNIGHTLGKCPQSPGAQFANCLLCNERGHLIKSCPQTYHGIDPKVVPGNEPIRTFLEELWDRAEAHRANMQGLEDLQEPKGPITRARASAKRIEQAMQSLVAAQGSTNMAGDQITDTPLLTTC